MSCPRAQPDLSSPAATARKRDYERCSSDVNRTMSYLRLNVVVDPQAADFCEHAEPDYGGMQILVHAQIEQYKILLSGDSMHDWGAGLLHV